MGKRRKLIDFDNSQKLFYSVKEVAEHFAINESTLRFWETEFEQINPKRAGRGIRQYSVQDIEQVAVVYNLLKERGLTIEGARQAMASKFDDYEKLESLRHRLFSLKQELLSLQKEFDTLHEIQKYSSTETE